MDASHVAFSWAKYHGKAQGKTQTKSSNHEASYPSGFPHHPQEIPDESQSSGSWQFNRYQNLIHQNPEVQHGPSFVASCFLHGSNSCHVLRQRTLTGWILQPVLKTKKLYDHGFFIATGQKFVRPFHSLRIWEATAKSSEARAHCLFCPSTPRVPTFWANCLAFW